MAVEQAEVLAATYATLLTEQFATKADIRALQKEITGLCTEITGLEERMGLKLQAVEQRLERKIVNTSLINVVATCTILGLVITILT